MSLADVGLVYLLIGLACAVAVYRAQRTEPARAAGQAAITVALWPLWAPIVLTGKPDAERQKVAEVPLDKPPPSSAAGRVQAALREGVAACAGTEHASLLSKEAADRIEAEVTRASARQAELERILDNPEFDVRAAEARVLELGKGGASARALATARLHVENVRRLTALRDRDACALEELADLMHALRTQLVLARFAGSTAKSASGIVSEVWARVDTLGVAIDSQDDDALEAIPNVSKHILVVDDEARIREVLQYALQKEGFQVTSAADGRAALAAIAAGGVDLVVLDIMLPEVDGLEVCREIRKKSLLPILFLSARGEEIDRVLGLELGGDDYLTKPFSPRELVARVRAVFRRVEASQEAPGVPRSLLEHRGIQLDTDRHEVRFSGRVVPLTPTEFGVLGCLLERPGVVFSRGQLMQRAYRYDNLITERTIDTHIRRIRAKFRAAGGDPIATVHGVGYKAAGD